MQTSYPGGYTFTKNSYKAGDEDCYDYSANSCAAGSATSAAGCGTSGASGWETGSTTDLYAGQSPCYECSMKSCPSGYATSVNDCGVGGFALSSSNSGFYGDSPCYKCVCDTNHCGENCTTELKSCENHPYTSTINHATMTGLCTIQTKSQDVCDTPQTVYSGFTCDGGYEPSGGKCVEVEPCVDGSSENRFTSLSACEQAIPYGGMYDFSANSHDRSCTPEFIKLTNCHKCSYNGGIYWEQRCIHPTVPDVSGHINCNVGNYNELHHPDSVHINCGLKTIGNTKCPYFEAYYPYDSSTERCDIEVGHLDAVLAYCLSTQTSTRAWTDPSVIDFGCVPNLDEADRY